MQKLRYIALTLFIIGCSFGFSQNYNLISNPSFEKVDTPVYWNSGTLINNSHFPATRNVTNWDWFNSPDYFSVFTPTGVFRGIPVNDFGTAYPKHGDAYAGISVYQGNVSDYKEYINQQLTIPLVSDSLYCLSFHVTFADRLQIAIKDIGAFFSVNTPSLVTNYYINETPQVVNNLGFITDTINWTEIQGCFTAQGGEQYITIGSFGDRASTDTVNTISNNSLTGPGSSFSYYYIDSVTLWQNSFPVGIKEQAKNEVVSVYPNPAKDVITFKFADAIEKRRIEIYDAFGELVLSDDASSQNPSFNIHHLANGIYFYRILVKGKTINTNKIVIIK